MVTVLIAFITFALGSTLTYYLNQTGPKKSEASNVELQEQVQRHRQAVERMTARLHELVRLAVQSGVDVTLQRTGQSSRESSRGDLYSASYEELKKTWRRSERREADGEPALSLPETLAFDAAGTASDAGGSRSNGPPRAAAAGSGADSGAAGAKEASGDDLGLEGIEEEDRLLRRDLSELEAGESAAPGGGAGTGTSGGTGAGSGAGAEGRDDGSRRDDDSRQAGDSQGSGEGDEEEVEDLEEL